MCLSITLRCPVSEMALLVLMEYGKDVHSLCVYYVHLVCTSLLRKVLCQQHVTWLSLVVCVCVSCGNVDLLNTNSSALGSLVMVLMLGGDVMLWRIPSLCQW